MSASTPFDLDAELPVGRLAIEASAGTGKTYALSTLAARYIAEAGVPVSELLVVTFTRAAAAELKDRVRARLVELAEQPDRDQQERERARTALGDFDSATITTIHGFAQQVLGTLGSAVALDPDAILIDDSGTLVEQVATDLLVAEAISGEHEPADVPKLGELRRAIQLVLGNPSARLVPAADDETAGAPARIRRALVDRALDEIDARRRRAGTLSFDDLLVRLRDALDDPVAGAAARAALARRFRVALIDEFQDTDPVQWDVFHAVFGRPVAGQEPTTLILVGDPKQAIYAFRGANVQTYLEAVRTEGTDRRELGTNWRSDPAVLAALEHLFRGATFGDREIEFVPVSPAEQNAERVLRTVTGAPHPALSIRLVDGEGIPRQKKSAHALVKDEAVFDDLVDHIRNLLETLEVPGDGEAPARPLRPDDIAVLVSANREAPDIRRRLARAGIPAVIARGDDVLSSDAAVHWHWLLAALAQPTDLRRVRAYALSWFGGRSAAWLTEAGDQDLIEVQEQLHRWSQLLAWRGVAALVGQVRADSSVAERVLALDDGDRAMTDLDHIGELLVLAAGRRATAASLLSLFEELSGGTDEGDVETDLAARRVESEARAVQIMTTFTSKGLEFPVVCVPSMWQGKGAKAEHNVWWDHGEGQRVIDIATSCAWGPADELEARVAAATAEAVGTNLRLLYVALTRARHHTSVWWLPTADACRTGLARVLFARTEGATIDPEAYEAATVDVPFGEDAVAALQPLVEASGQTIEVALVSAMDRPPRPWQPSGAEEPRELAAASLGRELPRDRRRWSFTAITAAAGGHGPSLDPVDESQGDAGAGDELDDDAAAALELEAPSGEEAPLPLGAPAGGAGFGTLVHEVLEVVDFTEPDLAAALGVAVDDGLRRNPWAVDRDVLVSGLVSVIETPLGPLFGDRALRGLPRADRLDELGFDLTLGLGGAVPTDADVGALLVDRLPADDPFAGWAGRLARGAFGVELAGHLTGSIDLVARIRTDGAPDRFVVCDYKTNRVAGRGVEPSGRHFRADRLARAMAEAHYPLQALLYSVAVHRYLRWRVVGYDPAVHLGGVGYLFVRGMVGPSTPVHGGVPEGLLEWHPPAEAICALSDLLDGR